MTEEQRKFIEPIEAQGKALRIIPNHPSVADFLSSDVPALLEALRSAWARIEELEKDRALRNE